MRLQRRIRDDVEGVQPAWLSVDETVIYTSISKTALYRNVFDRIKTRKLGRSLLINKASLDAFLEGLPSLPTLGHRPPRGHARRRRQDMTLTEKSVAKSRTPASGNTLYCGFCGKSQYKVRKLIKGTEANICDECLNLSLETLQKSESLAANTSAEEPRMCGIAEPPPASTATEAPPPAPTAPRREWLVKKALNLYEYHRVKSNGEVSTTWLFKTTIDGKRINRGLGNVRDMILRDAIAEVARIKKALREGRDVLARSNGRAR